MLFVIARYSSTIIRPAVGFVLFPAGAMTHNDKNNETSKYNEP